MHLKVTAVCMKLNIKKLPFKLKSSAVPDTNVHKDLKKTSKAAHLHSGSSLLLRFGLYFLERFL